MTQTTIVPPPPVTLYPYQIADIGTLRGGATNCNGINDSGEVSGYSDLANPSPNFHVIMRDKNGNLLDLGEFSAPNSLQYPLSPPPPGGINSSGKMTGLAYVQVNLKHGFFYNGSRLMDVEQQSTQNSIGYGINDSAIIVGDRGGSAPFLYENGTLHDLNKLLGDSVKNQWTLDSAQAINKANQICGVGGFRATMNSTPVTMGYLLLSFSLIDKIPNPPNSSYAVPRAINSLGNVVGYGSGNLPTPFVFFNANKSFVTLKLISPDTTGVALAINSQNLIVGASGVRAVIWQSSSQVPQDLNRMIDPSLGWILQAATGINSVGQICGYGMKAGVSTLRSFILTPTVAISSLSQKA